MTRWIALSEQTSPLAAPQVGLLGRGLLVAEIEFPLAEAAVLLDLRAGTGAEEVALSLFHDLGAGIALLHRQGGQVLRHVLPGPLPQKRGVARLSFGWDAGARRWSLALEQDGRRIAAEGAQVLPLRWDDVERLCVGGPGVLRHPAVLWFGVTEGAALPGPQAWLGMTTPVETPRGAVPAGQLKPGDRVMTADHDAVAVTGVTRIAVPSRGSLAPIRLRAPYYGAREDILVSPDQAVWVGGPEAEYLFGDEEVLVLARHLADGQMAVADSRRAVAIGVVLDLGAAELIRADGCLLATAGAAGLPPVRRLLDAYEAQPLRAALLGSQRRAV